MGGLISIGQPFLYLFRTRNRPSSFPTLVTHFSCVYRERRRGRRRKRKPVFPVVRRQFDGAALSVLCSRAASFLAAGQGETKDKLQRRPSCDPSHLTLYIYTGNTGLVSWEEIPRWTDNLLSSLFSSIEKFLTERISRAASIIFAMIASSSLYEDFRLISSLCFESKSEGYY